MKPRMECAIWNVDVELLPSHGDFHVFDSPRAGGRYRINDSVYRQVSSLDLPQKKLVTSWLCEQRRLGVEIPELTSYNLPQLLQRRPLRFSQRIENALMLFDKVTSYIGQYQHCAGEFMQRLAAESESNDAKEVTHSSASLAKWDLSNHIQRKRD
jgi:hypothetical protein